MVDRRTRWPGVDPKHFGYVREMAQEKHPEDEGIPPSDEGVPERPSDDNEHQPVLPADRPLEAHDAVTASEQRRGDSLNTRLAREEPESSGTKGEPRRDQAGRLIETTEDGRDVTKELVAEEVDDDAGLSAEEAAVSIRDDDQLDEDSSQRSA